MPPKFVPRERKHRRIARQQEAAAKDAANAEPNGSGSAAAVSGKKRKRLEKYIETKLKREENLELLKKLAAQKVDTSLLQSSKKLGRVKENKREQFQRALRERAAGIDVNGDQDAILFETRTVEDLEEPEDAQLVKTQPLDTQIVATQPETTSQAQSFGLGLKRPLDVGEDGQPVIARRKRRRPEPKALPIAVSPDLDTAESEEQGSSGEDSDEDGSEWNGFESETEDVEGSNGAAIIQEDGPDAASDHDEDGASEDTDQGEDESDRGSEDTDEEEESSESGDEDTSDKPARVSAFKEWALSQRNEVLGFTPSIAPTNDTSIRANFTPRAPSPDAEAVAATQTISSTPGFRPAAAVTVSRPDDIQTARLELPVVQDEQKIMEAVHGNSVVVICGATGSGKTTQLPQLLLENGYAAHGMIGVTQPRRVAATSVAARVAVELGSDFAKQVAHQVRYDSKNVSRDTKIKFMTDGILLREISQDFVLSKYSVLVIDEAHERSVNTDILIGMLSRIVPLRQELSTEQPDKYKPLKLVVMSATLRVSDFLLNERLFRGHKPPLVQVEGRQYQVTEHFARRTQRDYVTEMVRKVSRGHKKLPPGSILVFLTGQDEIQTVAKQLEESFRDDRIGFQNSMHRNGSRASTAPSNDYYENEDDGDSGSEAEIHGLDDYDDDDDEESEVEQDDSLPQQRGPLKAQILPLYAALPPDQQKRVFEPAAEGSRIIVLATNVAETSLTIPGVRYVFDCGRSKEKTYDVSTGVQEFQIDWISKASASQRMGRAGRTGPGHCYRLYSSAIYEQYFEEHTVPEILRSPIEGTVLQLKSMDVENVVGFPFPTPPGTAQLLQAERLLKNLGAIDAAGKVTDVGRELVKFPVNPRFGKILSLGQINHVLPLAIALVAGLAVGDLFVPPPFIQNTATKKETASGESSDDDRRTGILNAAGLSAAQKRQEAYSRAMNALSCFDAGADVLKILTAVAEHADKEDSAAIKEFCTEYFLREKGMAEVQLLRRQLHNIMLAQSRDGSIPAFQKKLPPPSQKQIALLKQIVAGGYVDQVAIRADLLPSAPKVKPGRRAIEVPYRTILPSNVAGFDPNVSTQQQEEWKNVYVHPSSVLARLSPAEMPPYIIYSDLTRATAKSLSEEPKKTRMRPLTTIGRKQLAVLAERTPLLEMGKPIGKIEEQEAGRRRECWVNVSLRDPAAAGTTGWPLGAWKVAQVRSGKDWAVEKVISRGAA